MVARRHGQGEGDLPLGNVLKCFLCCKYCKVAVDEVFMHYFEKNVVSFWGLHCLTPQGVCPWIPLGDFHHCPSLEEILRALVTRTSATAGMVHVGDHYAARRSRSFKVTDFDNN